MAFDLVGKLLLAVYGTLKENFPNYFYYLNPKKPIFQGMVKIPFVMYSYEGIPILIKAENNNSIYIEIYEVDEILLKKIDRLEGVPMNYVREKIFLDEVSEEVFIYIATDKEPIGDLLVDGFFPKRD